MRHHITPKNPVLHPMFGASITKFWERINKKPGLFGTRRKNQRFRDIQRNFKNYNYYFLITPWIWGLPFLHFSRPGCGGRWCSAGGGPRQCAADAHQGRRLNVGDGCAQFRQCWDGGMVPSGSLVFCKD